MTAKDEAIDSDRCAEATHGFIKGMQKDENTVDQQALANELGKLKLPCLLGNCGRVITQIVSHDGARLLKPTVHLLWYAKPSCIAISPCSENTDLESNWIPTESFGARVHPWQHPGSHWDPMERNGPSGPRNNGSITYR